MQKEQDKKIKRIGVLRGGQGEDYKSSLAKGGELIKHIFENLNDKYKVFDILVDKDYIWHLNGSPVNPGDLFHKVDLVWNTSHPSMSNILNSLSIPNVGVSAFHRGLEKSREMLREHVKSIGLDAPRSVLLPLYQKDFDGSSSQYAVKKAREVFGKFSSPWIIKSYTEDNSMGIHLAKTFPELVNSIEDGMKHGKSILIEEFIAGKVASVHSVAGFRDQDVYVFPLGNTFGIFSSEEKERLSGLVRKLYEHVDAQHYLKSDFVMNGRGRVYLVQIESIPDLKPYSHFSQAVESVGAKNHQIIEHIIEQALL